MVNLEKIKKKKEAAQQQREKEFKSKTKYTVIRKAGKVVDIRLGFGSYIGHRIKEMVNDPNATNYIQNFLLSKESGFDPKFRKRVQKAFDKYYVTCYLDDDIPI